MLLGNHYYLDEAQQSAFDDVADDYDVEDDTPAAIDNITSTKRSVDNAVVLNNPLASIRTSKDLHINLSPKEGQPLAIDTTCRR